MLRSSSPHLLLWTLLLTNRPLLTWTLDEIKDGHNLLKDDFIPTFIKRQTHLNWINNKSNLSSNIENESDQLLQIDKSDGEESRNHKIRRTKDYDENDKNLYKVAVAYGLNSLKELLEIKEPQWYQMGLFLDKNEPASRVAQFGAPGKRALELSRLGYAALKASKKIAESYTDNFSKQSSSFRFQSRLLEDDECPLRGLPRCTLASRRYRTSDGTCNNLKKPWRGSALLPMQRFLPPLYEDGIQEVRRSIFRTELPSARKISVKIHQDRNVELPTINLMFMQWGQFIDHDITSTVKSRSFNGSIPRCCLRGGQDFLPPELTHPSCLPIEVSKNDWFLSEFGIRCVEFLRSAPSTRIDCDLGYREQINQVTSFVDASTIYGSDVETADSLRSFRKGRLQYGRPQGREPLQPPDPPGGEICRFGALSSECFQGGDGRFTEQPGLTALHTIWLRYHNKIATILSQINNHWSDEKIYQESRRIVIALIQHITYREFLPIVLGQEVMKLFELNLEKKGFYEGYDIRINPAVSNAFSTAAYRFGHSLVQNSFVRSDIKHRPLFNNVSLHEEQDNPENIWSFGSVDRLVLGFCNQPSQRRDEFISSELTNHLFQSRGLPFGMDLAAINIQRGRDHGLPPYTHWREPCGLSPIKNWEHLKKTIHPDTVTQLKRLYEDVEDIDLFTGGLAEKPVRGGVVGPTFSCIIAQQFLNLRKGDRFWFENGGFESSFTPAQLQQIRKITFAQILCQTLTEIETIQPFVFLTHDDFRNSRISCKDPEINNFDLLAWVELHPNEIESRQDNNDERTGRKKRRKTNRPTTTRTTKKPKRTTTTKTTKKNGPLNIKVTNITTTVTNIKKKQYDNVVPQRPNFQQTYDRRTQRPYHNNDDVTYLVGTVSKTTPNPNPFEVNIKIQYYPHPTSTTTRRTTNRKRPNSNSNKKQKKPSSAGSYNRPSTVVGDYPIFVLSSSTTQNPYDNGEIFNDDETVPSSHRPIIRPQQSSNGYGDTQFQNEPFSTSKRPYIYRPNSNHYVYSNVYPRPTNNRPSYDYVQTTTKFPSYLYDTTTRRPQYFYGQQRPTYNKDSIDKYYAEVLDRLDYDDYHKRPTYAVSHIEKVPSGSIDDKLNFHLTRLHHENTKRPTQIGSGTKYVKISSVRGEEIFDEYDSANINVHVSHQRDGGVNLEHELIADDKTFVDLDLVPSEDRWAVYNATTDEDLPHIEFPDINCNISCSNEIPKPMTLTNTTDAKT